MPLSERDFVDVLFAQQAGEVAAGGVVLAFLLFAVALVVVQIAAMWKLFDKAGEPGWASLVPIYNLMALCKIVGRPGWWVLLMLIPFVSFVIAIILSVDLAKSFGKDGGYALLLVFLPFIGYPMLGFGEARYVGPAAT